METRGRLLSSERMERSPDGQKLIFTYKIEDYQKLSVLCCFYDADIVDSNGSLEEIKQYAPLTSDEKAPDGCVKVLSTSTRVDSITYSLYNGTDVNNVPKRMYYVVFTRIQKPEEKEFQFELFGEIVVPVYITYYPERKIEQYNGYSSVRLHIDNFEMYRCELENFWYELPCSDYHYKISNVDRSTGATPFFMVRNTNDADIILRYNRKGFKCVQYRNNK